jgi:anaerobic magnesium-protoporphyrin IX monomethyl ester cyclase
MKNKFNNIKVVLINPLNKFLADPLMSEPLGLMYIEGVLKELGVDVEMFDLSFNKKLPEADIFGFSATTIHFPQCVEYVKQVKGSFTVIGGPHASALPEEAKKYFDAVVIGPGEKAIIKILHDFVNSGKGGIYKYPVEDIDSIPIPPRTILNKIKYNVFPGAHISASLLSSRGCPYKCSFCASNVIWGRKVLFHSTERLVKEIQYLKEKFCITHFKFIDDVFTLNRSRFREVSKILNDLNIKWMCEARVDSVNNEILDQMTKSGCNWVNLGIESVNDIVLKKINKNQNSGIMEKTISKIKSRGLKVKLYIIYGLPFEPANIVQETIDFIEKTNPDHVSLFTLVPYPGTDIWNNPQKYNIKKIVTDFNAYQHAVGGVKEELSWLPVVEYNDRSREGMREERNILKQYTMEWNKRKYQ